MPPETPAIPQLTTLEYAPGAPVRRAKRRRRMIYAFVALVLIIVGYVKGPDLYHQAKFYYHWNICLRHRLPAEQVVYDDHPDRMEALLKSDSRLRHVGSAVLYVSDEYGRFAPARPRAPVPVFFLHGRRSPNGTLWLIAITPSQLERKKVGVDRLYDLWLHSHRPNGSTYWQWSIYGRLNSEEKRFLSPGKPLRLYAGQPDAEDESHFTLRFQLGERWGTIHGWVKNGGDVRFDMKLDEP